MDQAVDVEVKTRWLEAQGEATRRDVMLAQLRRDHRVGSSTTPKALDLRGIDLSGEDLSGLNLSGCDLSGANLSRCRLAKCNFSFASLDDALLTKAVLEQAEMMGSSLRRASLDECQATSAGMGAANLEEARLLGAHMENVTLSKSNLENADARAVQMTKARLVEANLRGARFTRAEMSECDLKDTQVKDANFESANLRGSRLMSMRGFRKASWTGADIRDIDLRGAYLIRRHIEDENYLFEFRTRDRLHAFIHWAWWATSDCGRSLGRWSLVLAAVVVLFGIAYRMVGVDFGNADGPLAPFYFSIVTLTTLGYGDILPQSTIAQVLASLEALLGYLGLGGLLSILANKMARRAE